MGAFIPRGQCSIPGCAAPHYAQGYCATHYGRWYRTGDPLLVLKPAPNAGYQGAHYRVYAARGPASAQRCRACGKPAEHWAYDHADPGERRDARRGGPYSLDPARYLPLCAACHLVFDGTNPY